MDVSVFWYEKKTSIIIPSSKGVRPLNPQNNSMSQSHDQAHFSDEKTFLDYTELLTIEVVPIFILYLEYTCPFAPLEMIRL